MLLDDLGTVPRLPGAACPGRWELFDATRGVRGPGGPARREALQLCASCPALQGCGDWLEGLPVRLRPVGVVAGRSLPKGREVAATGSGRGAGADCGSVCTSH